MGLRADGLLPVGIEDHNVRIRPNGNRSLFREQAEDFRCGRGRQFDKPVQADSFLDHAAIVDQAHAMLHAGTAIRNLAEVVAPEFFLFFKAKRTMVRGYDLEVVSSQSFPELILIRPVPQRWSHNVFCAFKTFLFI